MGNCVFYHTLINSIFSRIVPGRAKRFIVRNIQDEEKPFSSGATDEGPRTKPRFQQRFPARLASPSGGGCGYRPGLLRGSRFVPSGPRGGARQGDSEQDRSVVARIDLGGTHGDGGGDRPLEPNPSHAGLHRRHGTLPGADHLSRQGGRCGHPEGGQQHLELSSEDQASDQGPRFDDARFMDGKPFHER